MKESRGGELESRQGGPPRVLFLGTSLTAGYGLSEEEAYPARLAELLAEDGTPIEAVNGGVSGDTSAGGLSRLDWLLRGEPEILLIELGANDGLRGLPVEMTEANLREAIGKAQAAGATVVVAGMMMPPNYGEEYARDFRELFPRVAEETGSVLVPFLLEGVAAVPDLNLPDGIHPNAEGQRVVAETVRPYLVEVLTGL
ncbi:MAG: arylesterase [Thermoanaerobaculia bacterium]